MKHTWNSLSFMKKNVVILDASKDAEFGLNHKFVFWDIDFDFLINFAD